MNSTISFKNTLLNKSLHLIFLFFALFLVVGFANAGNPNITAGGATSFCQGGNVVLTATGYTGILQWKLNNVDINGATNATYTASQNGQYIVTATTGGVTVISNSITVTVNPNATISSPNNNSQNICSNTSIGNIEYSIGGGGTNATVTGLPTGVTGNFNGGNFTISGTPTVAGTYNYTVSTTGTCNQISASGTIIVKESPNLILLDKNHPFASVPFNNCGNTTTDPTFTITANNGTTDSSLITDYKVNWGDQTAVINPTNTDFPLNHTYTTFGVFPLVITATLNDGCSSSKTYDVINETNPAVGIQGPPNGSTQGCTPIGFWFKCTNYEKNTIGTTYQWDFGDGTSQITWTTPLTVDSIFHVFSTTSCTKPNSQFTVSLNATNLCTSTPATIGSIAIYAKPVAAFNPSSQNVCVNQVVSFINTSTLAYNSPDCNNITLYSWNFGDPSSGSNNTASSINTSHQYINPGIYTVTLIAIGLCSPDTITKTITVSTPPNVNAVPSQTICSSATVNIPAFTSSTVGTTYSWSNNNTTIGLQATGSGNIASFTATNSNTFQSVATITVTPSNAAGCSGTPITFTIAVNPSPQTPTINSPINECKNATPTALNATASTGSTLNWYTTATGGTASTTTPTISSATVGTQNFYVSQTNTSTGCESGRADIVVNVASIPSITSTSSNPTNCGSTDGFITLSGLTANTTYSLSYNNKVVNSNITSDGNGNYIISGLAAGSYSNIIVTNATGCPSNAVSESLSAPSSPAAPTITQPSPQTVCSGNNLSLSVSNPLNNATFTWSGAGINGSNNSGISININSIVIADSGTYSVTATVDNCPSPAANVRVIVNQTPATPTIAGNTILCSGIPLDLTASTTTAGSIVYTWTLPNSSTVNTSSIAVANAGSNNAGNYSVTATLGSCTSPATNTTIVVNPTPAITLGSTVQPSSCGSSTGKIILNGLATTTTYTVNYNGTSNSFSSDASGTLTITGLAASTYNNIFVTSAAGCNSDTIGPITLKDPNPPATPVASAFNDILCSGSTLSLTATSTTLGVSYSWTGPNNFTNTTQNPSISNIQTTGTGTYSVTATLAGCTSATDTVNVIVNQTPATPTIASIPSLCSGEQLTLNGSSSTTGNISYNWTGPNGFVSNTGISVINPVIAIDSGYYKVIATNTNGTFTCVSQPDSISVVVRPSITQATIIGSKDTLICGFTSSSNKTGILSGNLDATRPYETGTWAVVGKPAGASPSIAANTSKTTTITFDKSGVYLVQWAINNGVCAPSTDTIQFTVFDKPAITTPLIAPVNVCADNPVTITIDTNGIYGQIKYWQIKQPYTATSWMDTLVQTPSITFNNVQDTFRVRLVVISKNVAQCGNDSAFIDTLINVNPPSNAGIASTNGTSPLCYNSNSGTITLTGNTGSATWQSSTDSVNFANTSSTGQQYTYSNLTQNTWFRSAVKSGTCDTVFSNAVKIVVLPPLTISNAGNNVTLCADSIFQLQANTPLSNEIGTWSWLASSDSGTLDNKQNPTTFARGLKANTNYTLIWTISNNACTPSTSTVTITNLGPLTNIIDTATQTMCNSATVTVNGQTPTGGDKNYNYQWQVKQGNSWFSIQGATNVSYTFTADTTVILQRLVTDPPCTSASLQTTIFVQPPLGNNFITGSNQACINTSPGLLTGSVPTGAGGNFMYQWQSSIDTVNVGWANILGADTQNYTPPVLNLNDTNYYRRIVTTNLCSGSQANNSTGFVVFIRPNAVANWAIATDTSCAPFSINNNAVSPILDTITNGSYNWYAHDSLYGSNAAINPGYTLVPAYDSVTIKMVAVSRYGCKNDSLSGWFYTPPSPQTKFKVSDSSDCGPLADKLTNITPYLGYFQYSWNFGFDSTATSTLAQPGVVVFPPNPFNKDTIYTVTLTGFNQCDTVTYSRNIKVRSKAKAIFTPSATFGCSPLTDTFINTSRGDSTTYLWEFGDGTSKLAKDTLPLAHTYHTGSQDTFTVKLLAENYCGNDTGQYAIVVAAGTIKLRITVNGNELTGCNPSTVHFINTTQGASTFNWDFGDGNQAVSKQSPFNLDTITHRYDSVGTFNVTINASNNCTDTTGFETIKVLSTPKAAFVATPDTLCIGHPISFTNKSDATTGLIWNFGDGGNSLVTNPIYAYIKPGNYDVQLIAERQHPSFNTCMDTATRQVTVVPSLTGFISVVDTVSTCVPFTVTFANANAVSSKTCTWNFGDTTTGTGNTVTHTFTKVGSYSVLMNAVDTGGCTYTAAKQITVNGPAGSFAYDHGVVCGGSPVNFVATVTGTDSLQWNFGDNVFSTTLPNTPLYYTYPQSGKFLPSVTLLSANGSCMVQLKGTDTITIDYVNAGFTTSELKVCDTTTVNFIDTSNAWLGLKSWAWNFGNSKSSTIQNPKQVFLTSNTWPIQLIVRSNSGCSDTANVPTFIKVNNTPKATILADTIGCEDQPQLNIAAITSVDSVTYFDWQFSNGTSGNTDTINAYFATPGHYKTKLVIGTAYGCYDTLKASVLINPTPQVVTTPDFTLCKGQSAFINTTGATKYEWTPSTGLSCNTCPNPVANPIVTTNYVVAGFNSFGCADRDTLLITVPQPFTLTTSGNDTMCIGDKPNQLAAFGASNYSWSPSIGLSATNLATPLANPSLTTVYRVIGTDDYNCFADTSYLVVAVGTYPTVSLGPELVLSTGTNVTLSPVFTYPTDAAGPINKYVWSPSTYLSCDNCPNPVATVENDICYTLTATNIYGCSSNVDTLCVKAFCKNTQVFIANAFTPDGDGINDKLVVQGKGIKVVKSFRIFSRWGQVVFERDNFPANDPSFGWDGTIKGVPASPDVYVYTCEVTCENDVTFEYKGNTTIIK